MNPEVDTQFAADHEEGLVSFVEPSRRARFRQSLGSPKWRERLIGTLDHFPDLDYRWAYKASGMTAKAVYEHLRRCGAPSRCYVLSGSLDYYHRNASGVYGTSADLRQALEDLVDDSETLISCIPGRLAYITGETQDEQFILQRPQS